MSSEAKQNFRILAIDGGGIRGVVPAHIVHQIYSKFGIVPVKHFDLIAGTSTGSIIAAALACEIEPSKIIALYKEHGAQIFRKKRSLLPPWFSSVKSLLHSAYTHDALKQLLKNIFGDRKLGEIKFPLILPSTDVGNGGVHVFKSGYSEGFTRDPEVYVRDAVIASCSAPTFFDPYLVNEYLLADGGLWANNPALTSAIEAIHQLKKDPKNLRVLSLGTGHAKTYFEQKPSFFGWGFLTRWRSKDFISLILSLQSQAAHNHLKLMLEPTQWMRLDFDSDRELPLDDISTVDSLISKADRLFSNESAKLRSFLETM